jgi:O-antigen/teichoic acid export membrane protein
MTRTSQGKIVRNGLLTAVSWLVPLILAPVITPLLVRYLGEEQYGIYALVTGVMAYAGIGTGRAAAKFVS